MRQCTRPYPTPSCAAFGARAPPRTPDVALRSAHSLQSPEPRHSGPPAPRQRRPCAAAARQPEGGSEWGYYFASCHPGLEPTLARELASPAVGASDVQLGRAGVSFAGPVVVGYRANLWARTAIRVLQLLRQLDLDTSLPAGEQAYEAVREAAAWPGLLAPGQSFSVSAHVWDCSDLRNSELLAVRAKDAICDAIRDARGVKPAPPAAGRVADLPLHASAYRDRLTVYRDTSGQSLHRRGYRRAMHRASLNEAAAAGCLLLAGWPEACEDGHAVLADPMCGSGTLLLEAALMATNTAPGLYRRWWPFTTWPDFDPAAWREARGRAEGAVRQTRVRLLGNDLHPAALALARRDAEAAGLAGGVVLSRGGCADWEPPARPTLVVTNPPWGQRLQRAGGRDRGGFAPGLQGGGGFEEDEDEGYDGWIAQGDAGRAEAMPLEQSWRDLSTFLKRQCAGADAFILSGSAEASAALRLRAGRKHALTIGGVSCRLLQYEIRAGAGAGGATPAPPLTAGSPGGPV